MLTADKQSSKAVRSSQETPARPVPTEQDHAVYEAKLAGDYQPASNVNPSIFDIYKQKYQAPEGLFFDVAA